MANDTINTEIEFIGDLTNISYLVSAIWANEILNQYMQGLTQENKPIIIKEISLGFSGNIDDFDLVVPGILILSIIMLMFSATVAIVTEVEQKTIIRLKLSKITTFEFLSGVSIVQIVVGLFSVLLTGIVAYWLGFDFRGSFWSLLLKDVVPEIIAVVLLTIIYFLIGIWAFKARHMKVE